MGISQGPNPEFIRPNTKFIVFILILLPIIHNHGKVNGEGSNVTEVGVAGSQVIVSVFYETLCPYSVQFFRDQLIPTWEEIGQEGYFDVRFVPYGNAHTFFQGGLVVTGCQHGDYECFGNRLHACVLEYLPKELARDFIFCSMSLDSPPDAATNNCSNPIREEYNFHSDILENCVGGLPGELALALKGLQSLDFVTYGVPSISIDGVLVSDDGLNNFLPFICDKIKSNVEGSKGFEIPKGCQRI